MPFKHVSVRLMSLGGGLFFYVFIVFEGKRGRGEVWGVETRRGGVRGNCGRDVTYVKNKIK